MVCSSGAFLEGAIKRARDYAVAEAVQISNENGFAFNNYDVDYSGWQPSSGRLRRCLEALAG